MSDRYWVRCSAPRGWRVTFWLPTGGTRTYHWTRIIGMRIGPWFIGAIRGEEEIEDV